MAASALFYDPYSCMAYFIRALAYAKGDKNLEAAEKDLLEA